MIKIIKYVWLDILQNRIVLAYMLFLLVISGTLFGLESNGSKALMSLLNVTLMMVPLVSLMFTTIHFYNSYEFMELLLAQPIDRSRLLLGELCGVASSLATAFLLGVGLPIAWYHPTPTGAALLLAGLALTLIFVSLAFLASVSTRDKAKGIGLSLLIWLYFALLFDGLILTVVFMFSDYPLEKPMLIMAALNPVDLARIFIMLQMDVSALMGYTGAIYQAFFGSVGGSIYTLAALSVWLLIPIALTNRIFRSKDI